ncbi:MAG: acetate kinase [Spirochaetes bacterium GWF1_51_8]|nr:MAG: acetate kinase [Spirochaetes bacterium GWF1_51_8]
MKVLVINAGSSSLKYQLIDTITHQSITKGIVERIGADAEFSFSTRDDRKIKSAIDAKNHTQALTYVLDNLKDPANAFIKSLDEIDAIGHRVVHGAEEFSASVRIEEKVIKAIEKCCEIAPLHNPPNLQGILACREVLPDTPQVAVFDTAFHQTMPKSSYLYAIPYEFYEKYGIRRYGFHGTSHRYVTMKAAEFLDKKLDEFNCITCHLGNGSSIAAVKNGRSVDTSMGYTPLEGVVMGTRSGSIDPAIVFYLMKKENLDAKQVDDILNKKSGLLGLSGISNDLRTIWQEELKGNERAAVTRDVLVKSIRKYIGAYMVELGTVDAIIFTAGIGENDWNIRERCVSGLENFGIVLDNQVNRDAKGAITDLSPFGMKTHVLMVPTNEELMIALDTEGVLKK